VRQGDNRSVTERSRVASTPCVLAPRHARGEIRGETEDGDLSRGIVQPGRKPDVGPNVSSGHRFSPNIYASRYRVTRDPMQPGTYNCTRKRVLGAFLSLEFKEGYTHDRASDCVRRLLESYPRGFPIHLAFIMQFTSRLEALFVKGARSEAKLADSHRLQLRESVSPCVPARAQFNR